MDAYLISAAAGLVGAAIVFFLVQKFLEKERGRGFFIGDKDMASLFMVTLSLGFFVLFASLSVFLLKRDPLAFVLGSGIGLVAIFVSQAAIGRSLPKYAGASGRVLLGFAGIFFVAMAAAYVFIGAALPGGGFVPGGQLVSAKDDYLLFVLTVAATLALGVGYIYDAVKKKHG
jgi:hypothetical protein